MKKGLRITVLIEDPEDPRRERGAQRAGEKRRVPVSYDCKSGFLQRARAAGSSPRER